MKYFAGILVLSALLLCSNASAQPCSGDFDCDGTADGSDACPQDYFKTTTAGSCGCHFGGPGTNNSNGSNGSADYDGDGVSNCLDYCWWDLSQPSNPKHSQAQTIAPLCPCGVLDDNDSDGWYDCGEDECIGNPDKHEAGACGCDFLESHYDQDFDLVEDCYDFCYLDPFKTDPGYCGCGVLDVDTDEDMLYDCEDGCPSDPLKAEPGECGCGVEEGTC